MALKDVVKVNRRTFFNPRAWLGYDFLKEQVLLVAGIARRVFAREVPQRQETFEEALKRYNMDVAEADNIAATYFLFALFFLAAGVLLLGVSIYLLIKGSLAGFILALALTIFLLGQAFRNHFWYFQIKHRKLGCTFEEWREGKINTVQTKDESKGPPE